MMGQCTLYPDLNRCPHFAAEKLGCRENNTVCGFYKPADKKEPEIDYRKPKWFDQYYKR